MTDSNDDVKVDYDYSRNTYYELIEQGKESLQLAQRIAEETEHPRAIEVLAGMLKQVSDTNDKLMDLNKKMKELTQSEKKKVENQQNNFFIGSTSELQKMLKNADKGEVIEHDAGAKSGKLPR